MPCSDVTEIVQVVLDADERLKSYSFSKRTCGQGVGVAGLLMDHLRGRSVEELIAYEAEQFLTDYPIPDELEEFLSLKHLFAVQSALEVYTGLASGGPKDLCAAAEIAHDEGEVVIDARIMVDLVTEKIKSCGNCKGCGNAKAKVVFK